MRDLKIIEEYLECRTIGGERGVSIVEYSDWPSTIDDPIPSEGLIVIRWGKSLKKPDGQPFFIRNTTKGRCYALRFLIDAAETYVLLRSYLMRFR